MIGYAFTGSFCTHKRSLESMWQLLLSGYEILPIVSETVLATDTRFGNAKDLLRDLESMTGRAVISTVRDAEPLGPKTPLDALIVAPCTGNTLAKVANGITDTAVTMAVKAHLRTDRPLLIALASNDAMAANLKNIAAMLTRRSVYFVPLHQDDPVGKPHSLVADFDRLPHAFEAMMEGKQLRPLFL